MHWADKSADDLLRRGREHVIESGTSISGIPHIGNASDVIRGDAIRKALSDKKADVRFIWVADDCDPFRKIPRGMENLKNYLGFPVHDIPDPEGCHKNFVEHFVNPFISDLSKFGVEPEVFSAAKAYRKGEFYEEIKTALENSNKIAGILNKFRDKNNPLIDYIPWQPVCENCGKISTTRSYDWDGGDIVSYICEDREVSGGKVKGCKYLGESDIKKAQGKMPWRVEWAARWKHFKVTCEPLGKEHASSGGSFWSSQVITKEIFGWEPPMPVIYEFFTLNGEKISSSKGNVITLGQWLEIGEAEVLKAYMYKVLKKQRDIDLSKVPNMTDEYDEFEAIYAGIKEGDEKLKRLYELSQVNEPAMLQVPFTLCAVLSQIPNLTVDKISGKLKSMGYRDFDKERLKGRLKAAEGWVLKHGPEFLRFELLGENEAEPFKAGLSQLQKKGLQTIADEMESVEFTPKDLHVRIYQIARRTGLDPNDLFSAIYLVLVGKEKGPRAGSFLLTLDREFVINRFSGTG